MRAQRREPGARAVRKLVLYEAPRPAHACRPRRSPRWRALAAHGDWDAFSFTFFRDVIRVPVAELEALRATELWPPIVADAPASLGDLRALSAQLPAPARFRGLPMPVCLQVGTESRHELYVTDALAAVLPHARLQELTGAGARGHDDRAGDVRGRRHGIPARVRRDHAALWECAMKTQRRLASARHPLGSFGLLLVGLVGRLAEHAHSGRTDHGRQGVPRAPRHRRYRRHRLDVIHRRLDVARQRVAAARRDALAAAPRRRRKPA